MLKGFTPGCLKKCLSSQAMTVSISRGEISERLTLKRHLSSDERYILMGRPSLSVTTVDAGLKRFSSGRGQSKTNAINRANGIMTAAVGARHALHLRDARMILFIP